MFAGGFFCFFSFESGIQYFKKWCLKLSFFLPFSSERTPCFLWKVVFCVCYLGIYLFIFKSEFLVKLLSSRTWSFFGKKNKPKTKPPQSSAGKRLQWAASPCSAEAPARRGPEQSRACLPPPGEAVGSGRSCSRSPRPIAGHLAKGKVRPGLLASL